MIVLVDDRAGIATRRVHLIDRLIVRLRAPRLDNELARGCAPDSNFALALHAERLVRPSQRQLLARCLARIVDAAGSPATVRSRVPLARGRVFDDRGELKALIDRLRAMGPIDVRGVAMIRVLLTDGTGPLYATSSARNLNAELRTAFAAMDPLDRN